LSNPNTLTLNTKTAKTNAFVRMATFAYTNPYDPIKVRTIFGPLPYGRQLTHPLSVVVDYDDETQEYIVSEPRFYMHASAPTEVEAIPSFRRVFSGYLDVLTAQEEKLGPRLREQLQYLRSYIKPA
jgi:hypothetical protein